MSTTFSELYDWLVCPTDGCRLQTFLQPRGTGANYDEGCLLCSECETVWSIAEGIPRFVSKGNIDLDLDISHLESLRGVSSELPDRVLNANQDRLREWRDSGGGWERDEMKSWERYYAEKLETTDSDWAVTYNRLLPRQEHILAKLPPDLNRILEIGCGSSGTLWADRDFITGKTYYGTDLAFNALKLARKRLPGHYVLCDVNALPFREGAVDAILGFGILHHLPNHEQALESFSKSLASGGWLGFTEKLKTSDRIQNSRLVSLAKGLAFDVDRKHGAEEYVDGGNLLRLLDQLCPENYRVHYDYSIVRDILVKITLDKLRLNKASIARGIIAMDNLAVALLSPLSDLFQPKNITFVAQKQ